MVKSNYVKIFDAFNNSHFCDRCGAEMFTNMHMDEPEKNGIDICQKCGIELREKEKNEKNRRYWRKIFRSGARGLGKKNALGKKRNGKTDCKRRLALLRRLRK